MKKKKSQISIQFSWIFILIAGAIILIFFIGIIYKQKAVSETRLAGTVATDLEAILTGARISTGTVNVIQIPKIEATFTCDEMGDSWFGVDWEKTGIKKSLPIEVVFAPNLIKGKELITWALDFSAPFKVTNFLYLTSPEIRYIFVNPDEEIYEDFPEETTKEEVLTMAGISDKNNYKVKFIFFDQAPGTVPAPLQHMPNKDITAIKITGKTIEFFEKENSRFKSTGQTFYITKPMLYAAIFAEDKIYYECNLKKAFKALNIVATVYADRETTLKEYYENNPDDRRAYCTLYYYEEDTTALKQISEACIQDMINCPGLSDPIAKLEHDNLILKEHSCPLLY